MAREIRLSTGDVTIVDDEDYGFMSDFSWTELDGYACTSRCFYTPSRPHVKKRFFMHRLLTDPPPGLEVDHIDRNRLNNRKSNLRLVERIENMTNKSFYRNNSSGYKGVGWEQKSGKHYGYWRADFRHLGRSTFLGYFQTKEDAARAWNDAARAAGRTEDSLNRVKTRLADEEREDQRIKANARRMGAQS